MDPRNPGLGADTPQDQTKNTPASPSPTLGSGKVDYARVQTSPNTSHVDLLNGGPSTFHQNRPDLAWRVMGLALVGGAGSQVKSTLDEGSKDNFLDITGVG